MLHAQLVGEAWDSLPEPVRRCHLPGRYRGRIVVTHHSWLARPLGFPPAGEMSIELRIEVKDGIQVWTRYFGDFEMVTTQYEHDGALVEARGPIAMQLDLVVEHGTLIYRQKESLLGPRVHAIAWATGEAMHVRVAIGVPVIGAIVGYEGALC